LPVIQTKNRVRESKQEAFCSLKILLIEHNPGDVILIQQILTATLASVEIRVAMDGEQALRMLCDTDLNPDLIILDLNIPKVPGIDFDEFEKVVKRMIQDWASSKPQATGTACG
jgi:CheY-like chemotaxis protein